MKILRDFVVAVVLIALSVEAHAAAPACVNRFIVRSQGSKQVVTLLTGKLTFPETQALIAAGKAASVDWVDEKGKSQAKAIEIRAVRPMPVGCDGRTSGVVLIATFLSLHPPVEKMYLKLDAPAPVLFTQQKD